MAASQMEIIGTSDKHLNKGYIFSNTISMLCVQNMITYYIVVMWEKCPFL